MYICVKIDDCLVNDRMSNYQEGNK